MVSSSWIICCVVASLALMSACASNSMKISSNPEGAEVSSLQGEVLGKTPLTLSDEQKSKIADKGLLNFKVSAPGHLPRLVYADESSAREISVALPKSEAESFKSEFSRDFGQDLNKMLRSAFVIQKLIAERKVSEASQEVAAFKKNYPALAFGHVMTAHLALMQGRKEEAQISLLRARILDPTDPEVAQALKLIGLAGPTAASGGAP